MRRSATLILAALALLFVSEAALAHAHLKSASPAPKSTARTAPTEVTIDFTEALEPKLSAIEVTDSSGMRVDDAAVHLDPRDAKRLIVGLKAAPAGIYTVTWRATSVDAHKTEGAYIFTIAP